MSVKNKKKKVAKDINQILLIVLLVCTVLCFLLGVSLYAIGIRRILPVMLIFVFAFLLSIAILLLSRNTYFVRKAKDRQLR